jgi:hypothetical protein
MVFKDKAIKIALDRFLEILESLENTSLPIIRAVKNASKLAFLSIIFVSTIFSVLQGMPSLTPVFEKRSIPARMHIALRFR